MKLSLEKVILMKSGLINLSGVKLPVKRAFGLMKFIKKVDEEIKLFEEKRTAILNQYGKQEESGNYIVEQENMVAFNKDMAELASIEVEIGDIEPFTMKEVQNDMLCARDFLALEPIFKDE